MAGRNRSPETMAAWVRERECRREPRVRVSMFVLVEVAPDHRIAGEILDLSRHGFRLRSVETLEGYESVRLVTRQGAFDGLLRWVNGLEAGGAFTDV